MTSLDGIAPARNRIDYLLQELRCASIRARSMGG